MKWWNRARKLPWREYGEFAKENTIYFVQVGCAVHVFQTYVAELTMCMGPSMLPTFNVSGDVVVMERISPRWNRIEVGDVIVAHSPTDHTQTICKRVLAMEGDQILLHAYGQPVTIPKGHVWLAGDNTANSTDSRTYGPVPQALIKGRVFYKIWPPQCMGPIPNTLKVWEKPPGEVSRFDLRHRIRRRYTPAASEEPGPSSPPEEVNEETEQSAGRLGSGETPIEPNPAMDPAPRSAGQDASAVQTVQAEGGSGGFSEGISEGDGWTNGDPQRVAAGGENRLT